MENDTYMYIYYILTIEILIAAQGNWLLPRLLLKVNEIYTNNKTTHAS